MRKLALFTALILYNLSTIAQGSVSATYTDGDIPTGYNGGSWDPSCNGTSTTLAVNLPQGLQFEVVGIDISYDMVANPNLWMSGQNSQIHFQTNSISETFVAEGTGDMPGTESYSRTGVGIANGIYQGGTPLIFEMRAWRDYQTGTSGCSTATGNVANGTWTITVHYGAEMIPPRVGINNTEPKATLDVGGEIILGSDGNPPEAGMIKWDAQNQDFMGFDGTEWKSLTIIKDTCPTYMKSFSSQLCIDSIPNLATTFNNALLDCNSKGERLPSYQEIYQAYSLGAIEFNNNFAWTTALQYDFPNRYAIIARTSDIDNFTISNVSSSYSYYCVYEK